MAAWRIGIALMAIAVAASARAAEPPLTIVRSDNAFDVSPDGTYVQTYRFEFRPGNDAAARRDAQQAVGYSPSLEDFTITEAYTRKPDGRRVPVGPGAIHDQLPAGSADLASFSDRRQKVMVFPDVAGGDTLVYAWRRAVHRPVFAGEFMTSLFMPRTTPWADMTLTVRVPATMELHTETHGMEASVEPDGAANIYRWHASNPVPQPDDSAAVGPYDRLPRVFVSSFAGYRDFAAAYAALASPKARVTPPVQALADRLTAGVENRREQARLLYDWVSLNIRYVAVYLNQGALEPHDADAVLADGYGDCKDHVVLFDALLEARGITSELAIINFGAHYTLSGPPTFAQLNHAITYLPEFGLYADTTAGTAPFGTLPFQEYGKPVIHAAGRGPVLRRVPDLPAGVASTDLRTTATMGADGAISGTTTTVARGPFAVDLRRTAVWAEASGIANAAASQLRALGTEGSGAFAFDRPGALAPSFEMGGSFRLDARTDIVEGDSFVPPTGLRVLNRPGDQLLGPLGMRVLADDEPTPCFAGRQSEEISLTLPAGRHLARLPNGVEIDNALLAYRSRWSMQGDTLVVRRDLVSRPAATLCSGDVRKLAAQALAVIRRDERRQVALADE